MGPQRLASTVHEKVWGAPDTEPWYRNPERRDIGEIWFSASDSMPLLVKLLFTSDKLSVQVHPDDEYALANCGSLGKTEMWHILRAEPESQIALGLRERTPRDVLEKAAASAEIIQLLNWVTVHPGDTFFVPAGTIHAIGAGIVLAEVQQRSDITFRLHDYGRQREIHLDEALAVSSLDAFHAARTSLPLECDYFRTERFEVAGSLRATPTGPAIYIVLEGSGSLAGEPFNPGEAWEAAPGCEPFEIASPGAAFLVTGPL